MRMARITTRTSRMARPAADPHQPIQGTGWAQEALSGSYQRLPDRAEKTVRKQVWDLSQDCAGMYLKFHTNATSIQVRYQVSGALSLPHMPATGVSGVDLYATDCNGRQYWCAPQFQFGDTICYTYPRLTYRNNHGKGNEYTLYLPLYNHVRWLQIGTPEGSLFGFLRHTREKPVVIYGTSIAQGACASRPAWPGATSCNVSWTCPSSTSAFRATDSWKKRYSTCWPKPTRPST